MALIPAAWSRAITSDQHDPSANSPWTSTTFRALGAGCATAALPHVDIARRIARAGEVAKQPAVRVLELVDAAARVNQHQLVARVDEGSVDFQSHWARRLESGCEQASCVLGPIAPQRFGWERERAVADDGDLDGTELEAVEARLRPLACLGRMARAGVAGASAAAPRAAEPARRSIRRSSMSMSVLLCLTRLVIRKISCCLT